MTGDDTGPRIKKGCLVQQPFIIMVSEMFLE